MASLTELMVWLDTFEKNKENNITYTYLILFEYYREHVDVEVDAAFSDIPKLQSSTGWFKF